MWKNGEHRHPDKYWKLHAQINTWGCGTSSSLGCSVASCPQIWKLSKKLSWTVEPGFWTNAQRQNPCGGSSGGSMDAVRISLFSGSHWHLNRTLLNRDLASLTFQISKFFWGSTLPDLPRLTPSPLYNLNPSNNTGPPQKTIIYPVVNCQPPPSSPWLPPLLLSSVLL